MKIVLFQPQIPQNTGNIVRTCSVTGTELILVRPLGFSTHSRHLKRAGLDYFEGVDVTEIDCLKTYLERLKPPVLFFSSKASKIYTEAPYESDTHLIFGSETSGLPDYYFNNYSDNFYKIPMRNGARCLNLATSVGIALFEGIRQEGSLLTSKSI